MPALDGERNPDCSAVVQRILCDGTLLPLVVGENGQPLFAGRSVRTANDTQWKALIARDGAEAMTAADRLLKEDVADLEALRGKAWAYYHLGDADAALGRARTAVAAQAL